MPQTQLATGSSTSPYQSGYNHGSTMLGYQIHQTDTLTNQKEVQAFILTSLCKVITLDLVPVLVVLLTLIPVVAALADGQRDGKAQGHSDAINGFRSDDRCGS